MNLLDGYRPLMSREIGKGPGHPPHPMDATGGDPALTQAGLEQAPSGAMERG